MNFDGALAFQPDFTCEWRVYVNADLDNAPIIFSHVLDLFTDLKCRITSAKITTVLAEASKRTDVIVIYTDSEDSAKRVSSCLLFNLDVSRRLGAENVHMACRRGRGVAIGESPVAISEISFGDLRAAVLSLAVRNVCQHPGNADLDFHTFLHDLNYWLPFFIRAFGLSEQDSFRNGDTSKQPKTKEELRAKLKYWEKQI